MSTRKHDLDNLSQCAKAAKEKGLTYGKYMATYRPTIPEKEYIEIPGNKKKCPFCGRTFISHNRGRRYCSDFCKYEMDRARRSSGASAGDSVVVATKPNGDMYTFRTFADAELWVEEHIGGCGHGIIKRKMEKDGGVTEYAGYTWRTTVIPEGRGSNL